MEREKVIRGLECIISCGNAGMRDDCANCIYPGGGDCLAPAFRDALALLKAQEPRVMTLEELRMNEVYWAEQEDISRPWPIAMHHIRNACLLDGPMYQDYMGDNLNAKEYGIKWRCWTSRPTDEQREATPWIS